MLIPFSDLIYKHKLNIRGVIHVGAHYGQEVADYKRFGIDEIVLIEPASVAVNHLMRKFGGVKGIHIFNVACGAEEREALMHIETHNGGQSNSLLKPGTHLKHYPLIKFNGAETVKVVPLRSLDIDFEKYNLLNVDCQGFELEVLKGADLTHIDAIYTEVNREEVYEGAAMVEEIDDFLTDFKRVQTVWTDQGWGDGLLVRKSLIK